MANQDNPIFRVVNETLGLGGGPKSFEDQTSRLRAALDDAGYVFEAGRAEDVDIYRKAGKSVKLWGFERVADKEGTEKLFEKINTLPVKILSGSLHENNTNLMSWCLNF